MHSTESDKNITRGRLYQRRLAYTRKNAQVVTSLQTDSTESVLSDSTESDKNITRSGHTGYINLQLT